MLRPLLAITILGHKLQAAVWVPNGLQLDPAPCRSNTTAVCQRPEVRGKSGCWRKTQADPLSLGPLAEL